MKTVCTFALLFIAATARAELTVFAGVEYFNWQEDTSPSVKETGPLLAGGLIWMQDKEQGLLFGYRGEIYFGQVNYNGAELFTGAPATANVDYFGVLNEGQIRYRFPLRGNRALGCSASGGRGSLAAAVSRQRSDGGLGRVYARRAQNSVPRPASQDGSLRLGLKYPVYTYENAHLTDIGFDQNPTLTPGQGLERVCQRRLSLRRPLERDGVLRLLPLSAVRERAGYAKRDSIFHVSAQELDECARYTGPLLFLSGAVGSARCGNRSTETFDTQFPPKIHGYEKGPAKKLNQNLNVAPSTGPVMRRSNLLAVYVVREAAHQEHRVTPLEVIAHA